jgi:hypothetical protein
VSSAICAPCAADCWHAIDAAQTSSGRSRTITSCDTKVAPVSPRP